MLLRPYDTRSPAPPLCRTCAWRRQAEAMQDAGGWHPREADAMPAHFLPKDGTRSRFFAGSAGAAVVEELATAAASELLLPAVEDWSVLSVLASVPASLFCTFQ